MGIELGARPEEKWYVFSTQFRHLFDLHEHVFLVGCMMTKVMSSTWRPRQAGRGEGSVEKWMRSWMNK